MSLNAIERVFKGLSERDKRTLKVGAVCVAGLLAVLVVTKWLGYWAEIRGSLGAMRQELKAVGDEQAEQERLWSVVPVFEMPLSQEKQKFLFRDKLNEQLKQAGVKSEALQFLPIEKSRREDGYRLLRLQCRRAKCNFQQVLDLLAALEENPYLAGVDEFAIRCDPKKREKFELDLTVSTFVR